MDWQQRLTAAGSSAGQAKGVDRKNRELFKYDCGCYGFKQIRSLRRRMSALACPEHGRRRKPSQLLLDVLAAVRAVVPTAGPIVLEACLLPKGSKAFDLRLSKYNIAMEADGPQHFSGKMHDKAAQQQYERDRRVDAACQQERIRLLRFHYADHKHWGSLMQQAVQAVKQNPHCWFCWCTSTYEVEACKRAAAVAAPTV